MKIGDLIKRVGITPDEIADYAELGIGIIIGVENRKADYCHTTMDLIVMWPSHGIGWEYPDRLEVVNASR
jgi:hypothetical protein